ncbi:MAG: cysteine--tRNA ligase, partial [Chitinophagaceae bacterium]|nr:cysteine--tRNA ligase [Chitinophagaceae bacterium]
NWQATDTALDEKINKQITEFTTFIEDDFSTAKVLANMFEIVPVINGIKNKQLPINSISSATIALMKQQYKIFIEDIFGLTYNINGDNNILNDVLQLLIDIRKEAKANKNFVTSDKIRNELMQLGIQLKDEKDGNVSWSID